jgi:hypothetical protein
MEARFWKQKSHPCIKDALNPVEPSFIPGKNGAADTPTFAVEAFSLSFATYLFFVLGLYVLFLGVRLDVATHFTYFASLLH